MRILRTASLVATLSCSPLALATPAVAAPAGVGAATAQSCGGLHCVTVALDATVTPTERSDRALVAWTCHAIGTVDAASTRITECSVGGFSAPPVALPGAYATAAYTAIFPIGSGVMACVGGESVFVEAVLGPQKVGDSGCTPLLVTRIDA